MSLAVALYIKTLSAHINTSKKQNKTIIIKIFLSIAVNRPLLFQAADCIQCSIHKFNP